MIEGADLPQTHHDIRTKPTPHFKLLAVAENFDPVAHNRAAWDREVDNDNEWTRPVDSEVIARARAGEWSVVLIGHDPVPRDWFPAQLIGVAVLCLASGGGQQGPVLSAAGAEVTVFDNSPRQLRRDEEVAARDGLTIRTVLGDMRDLDAFPDASFNVVFNPVSNVFCPQLAPVWRESFRVLRTGGILLAGFMNPDVFIFDVAGLERDELIVRYPLPFSSLGLPEAERAQYYGDGPIEFSHSLTEQIGGQLAAGFTLTHLVEAPRHADATGRYMPGYIATRAIKPGLRPDPAVSSIGRQPSNIPIATRRQPGSSAVTGPATSPIAAHSDANRRRLTPDECCDLLSRPVAGVFSSQAADGWIHSVPVHFLHRNGEIRVCCGTNSTKAANVDRTSRATLCIEVTTGPERRYVTVEGPAHVERPANAHDLTALDEKYSRTDTADWTESDYAREATIVLRPDRWIAWSDWD